MLKLVFFWENGVFHWKKRIFKKFFSWKTEVSTIKYYSICKVLFYTRKPRFRCWNLYFFCENGVFHWKKRIFKKFSLQKLRFRTIKYYSDVKYPFLRENLVFDVKTCIFLRKRCFPLEKTDFQEVFSTKTEVSAIKYYFICKVLFYTRKPRFRC